MSKKPFVIWIIIVVGIVSALYISGTIPQMGNTPNNSQQQTPSTSQNVPKTPAQTAQKSTQTVQPSDGVFNVSDINQSTIGRTVTIKGIVSDIRRPKNTTFFSFQDVETKNSINGVLFDKTNKDNEDRFEILQMSQRENKPIFINGKIAVYEGALEVKVWKVWTE